MRAIRLGSAYFAAVFLAGFVLGAGEAVATGAVAFAAFPNLRRSS
jgi:hypothetical protein